MNITNRLYTYPVLNEDRDDYIDCTFKVDINVKMKGVNSVVFDIEIKMNNDELEKMIGDGLAEYVIHIECSNTAFRKAFRGVTKKVSEEIEIGKLNGRVEIIAMIVAKKDIERFTNTKWNEDYMGLTFEIAKGSVLAYQNMPNFDIIKNYEELENSASIFKIQKLVTEKTMPMEVDLDSDYIGIRVAIKEYDIYSRLCDLESLQPILNAMIILPALVYIFEALREEGAIGDFEKRLWYISLSKSYLKRGVNLEDEIINSDKTSIQLAQEAMEYPLVSALSRLTDVIENNFEEEA